MNALVYTLRATGLFDHSLTVRLKIFSSYENIANGMSEKGRSLDQLQHLVFFVNCRSVHVTGFSKSLRLQRTHHNFQLFNIYSAY